MKRALDAITLLLLVAAVAQAVALTLRPAPAGVALVLLPGTPEELAAPGGVQGATAAVTEVGELVTIEDLARLSLRLAEGDEVKGVAPLSAAEREALRPVVARAREHRGALLQEEAALRAAEAEVDAAALQVLAGLDPEQQRWMLAHRDELSVSGVEDAYWTRLADALEAAPRETAPVEAQP